MIEKHECLTGVTGVVNNRPSKWNQEMGAKNNGLVCFVFKQDGFSVGDKEYEVPVGTNIEVVVKPKRIGESGVQVRFKVEGDETILAAWWVVFKHKIDRTYPVNVQAL